jgi:hypothetical protein
MIAKMMNSVKLVNVRVVVFVLLLALFVLGAGAPGCPGC